MKINSLVVSNIFFAFILPFFLGCGGDDGGSSDLGSISGTITFENIALWPDTGEVQVVVFPVNVWQSFGPLGPPQNFNDPLVLTKNGSQTQYTYTVEGLPEGDYSSLAVGWRRPNSQNYPGSKRTATIGVHWENSGTTSMGVTIPGTLLNDPPPAVISLNKSENITGLNFRADFRWVKINQDSVWTLP